MTKTFARSRATSFSITVGFLASAACSSSSSAGLTDGGAITLPDVALPGHDSGKGHDAGHKPDATIAGDAGADAVTPFDAPLSSDGGDASVEGDTGVDAQGDSSTPFDAGHDGAGVDSSSAHDAVADHEIDSAHDSGHDSGSPSAPTVLLFAGSPSGLLAGTFKAGGTWVTQALTDATSFGTSLTIDSSGRGIGAYTSATGGIVRFTVWSGGAWSAPAAIIASAVSQGQPFLDATGSSSAHLVYQDGTYHYWSVDYAGSWDMPQAVGTAMGQNYGPVAATIAALGTGATAAFIDGQGPNQNDVAEADLAAGTWSARIDIAGPESFTVPPSIISLSAGPELMTVFVTQGSQMMFVTRTAGVWSTPTAIANALTNDRVAVAPLSNGGAIAAFRGTDNNLYWSTYSAGAWSTVAAFATPNMATDTSPAVTHGISGDVAELAYVSGGIAFHSRLSGATWGVPVNVGGTGLVGVAVAATP
jgi:hypothetical protein